MPTFDYSGSALDALALIQEFGQEVTFERVNDTIDPVSGVVTPGADVVLESTFTIQVEGFDYAGAAQDALDLIEEFGQEVTFERLEGSYVPGTGEIDDSQIRVTEEGIDVTETDIDVFGNPL